jgi:hypothetical protein
MLVLLHVMKPAEGTRDNFSVAGNLTMLIWNYKSICKAEIACVDSPIHLLLQPGSAPPAYFLIRINLELI